METLVDRGRRATALACVAAGMAALALAGLLSLGGERTGGPAGEASAWMAE